MNKIVFSFLLLTTLKVQAQKIKLTTAKFTTENNDAFKAENYNDNDWKEIKTGINYELQGYDSYNGYSWYRMKTIIPTSIKASSFWKDSLRFDFGKIDDCDEVYLNGTLINKSGRFPYEDGGYITTWNNPQQIYIATNNPLIHWDKQNTIAIKVYDGNGGGGLFGNEAFINMVDLVDGIKVTSEALADNKINIIVTNNFDKAITGVLQINNRNTTKNYSSFTLNKDEQKIITYSYSTTDYSQKIEAAFIESNTQKKALALFNTQYILTPKPAPAPSPQINTAGEYGVGVNKLFLYKIPATGQKPLFYTVNNLPEGLLLDANTGIITGSISTKGIYNTKIIVKNKIATATKKFIIKVGKGTALTPPMGWNSWNCWGLSISDAKVKASAQAMIDKGLTDHGWSFINIDDGWEAKERNTNGEIVANNKFSDMKGLGDWLHTNGLKFGIYSSPGPLTCGGYIGSYQHEMQDATTYANWGVDYLKYDWCSYENIHKVEDTSLISFQAPYTLMYKELKKQNRDIVYSLCQYGIKDVWRWGASVGGNLWRTTGDIEDTWESLKRIGFSQTKQQDYAKPGGGWNDADMMIVGKVGWGENLHPSRLSPDEQYTHVSLWALLNNPLLIGCDMSKLDDFTLNLLTNDEVIAINQNTFSTPAKPIFKNKDYEVWVKQTNKTEYAIGIFNLNESNQAINIKWKDIGISTTIKTIRDAWRQKNEKVESEIYKTIVYGHGVKLIICTVNY